MSRPHFDEPYLLAYSAEHVAYEVDQFFKMSRILHPPSEIRARLHSETHTINMALIEACGIHLRNVIEFIYGDYPKDTDIVAVDFCANWQNIRPAISDTLKVARSRAHKELAHLTTARKDGRPPEKAWDFAGLANEIRPILVTLAANARATALSPNVSRAAS